MRVLWCTHSLAGFQAENGGYNGCGWITSLLKEFRNNPDIEIGIAFYIKESCDSVQRDGVTFFPMKQGRIGFFDKLKSFFGNTTGWIKEEEKHIVGLHSVIDTFQPDIIHVWGTETDMGLIATETNIPVVIHLQGLLHPYNNILCPPGFSRWDYIRKDGYNPVKMLLNLNGLQYWQYKADREVRIFKVCKNYFGRTHWDKAVSRLFSPQSNYYYCSEMLRDEFYSGERWTRPEGKRFRIVSTISSPLYKGMDMVLKTAKLLKEYTDVDFEWNVIGVTNVSFVEKKLRINASDVNVRLLGVKSAQEIKELELGSDLYVHPSYIDNSPNSVCEAQMLGLPIIAVNVGGVSSLIQHEKSGWLLPSNEPHISASLIRNIWDNNCNIDNDFVQLSAFNRHCKKAIVSDLLSGYHKILNKDKC